MKNMFLTPLLLGGFMIGSPNLFAQFQDEDCIIYKKVLEYFNSEFSKVKYTGVKGVTDPTDPHQDSVLATVKYRYNFFIIKEKDIFGVRFFSRTVKDTTLDQHIYTSTEDTLIRCTFSKTLKYQYKSFEEIDFKKKDFIKEIIGVDTFQYVPMRIFFSKVLYAKSIALLNARIYTGLGHGRDIATYSFVYRKQEDNWVLEKVGKTTS